MLFIHIMHVHKCHRSTVSGSHFIISWFVVDRVRVSARSIRCRLTDDDDAKRKLQTEQQRVQRRRRRRQIYPTHTDAAAYPPLCSGFSPESVTRGRGKEGGGRGEGDEGKGGRGRGRGESEGRRISKGRYRHRER